MGSLRSRVLRIACLLLAASASRGLKRNFSFRFDGPEMKELLQPSGIVRGGTITVAADGVSKVGVGATVLVIVTQDQVSEFYGALPTWGSYGDTEILRLCDMPSTLRLELSELGRLGNVTFALEETNQYSAYLFHCGAHVAAADVSLAFLNYDREGELAQHLPIEEAVNPLLFWWAGFTYSVLLVLWIAECIKEYRDVTEVHFWCLVPLLARAASCFLSHALSTRRSKDGEAGLTLRVAQKLMSNAAWGSYMIVILLISVGWGISRRRLSVREQRLLLSSSVVYGTILVFDSFCFEDRSVGCRAFELTEYIIESLIFLLTMVAMNFNKTNLRAYIGESTWSETTIAQYFQMHQFNLFRNAFISFLFLSSCLLVLRMTVLSWHYSWLVTALGEIGVLAITMQLGVCLIPRAPSKIANVFQRVGRRERGDQAPPADE